MKCPSPMRSRTILIVLALIIITISVKTCRNAGQFLVKKDEVVNVDAMVVLMGSIPDRSLQAADLYNKGIVDKVILVEATLGGYQKLVDKGIEIVTNTEIMRNSMVSRGIPPEKIVILPGKANSTRMEACIVSDYLRKDHSIDTIIVVSSNYHTRRASMIFRSELNYKENPVRVLVYPSSYTEFSPEKWWRNRKDIKIVQLENIKIFAFFTFDKWRACAE